MYYILKKFIFVEKFFLVAYAELIKFNNIQFLNVIQSKNTV